MLGSRSASRNFEVLQLKIRGEVDRSEWYISTIWKFSGSPQLRVARACRSWLQDRVARWLTDTFTNDSSNFTPCRRHRQAKASRPPKPRQTFTRNYRPCMPNKRKEPQASRGTSAYLACRYAVHCTWLVDPDYRSTTAQEEIGGK